MLKSQIVSATFSQGLYFLVCCFKLAAFPITKLPGEIQARHQMVIMTLQFLRSEDRFFPCLVNLMLTERYAMAWLC